MNPAISDSSFSVNSGHFTNLEQLLSHHYIDTICLIALVLGLGIIFIGYKYSGGRENHSKIVFSVSISIILGVLILPLLLKGALKIGVFQDLWSWGMILVIEIVFVAFVGVHAYEMTTVTAEEANARRDE